MASIPLPALSIKPPEDPLTGYAKAMSIRGMQQQQKEGDLEIQQKQQALNDQKAMTAAMQQWDGKSYESLIPLVVKGGGSANAVMGLKQHALETQQKYAQIAKDDADTGKNQVETQLKKNDMVAGALSSALQVPDEQLAEAVMQTAQNLASQGLIDKQHLVMAQQLVQSGAPPQQVRQSLDMFRKGYLADSQLMAEAKSKTEAQKAADEHASAQAQLPGQQASSDEKVRANFASQLAGAKDQASYEQMLGELPMKYAKAFPQQFDNDAVLQAGMTPHEQASIPTDKLEMKDWLAKNPGKGPSDFLKAKALLVPQFKMTVENGGPVKAADGSTDVEATAKKFGMSADAFNQQAEKYYQTGQLPPAGRGMMGPAFQRALMNRTAELHPEGDLAANSKAFAANADSLKSIQKNFDQVTAFENTAGKNLDLFLKQAQPIVNSGSPWLNTPLRTLSDKMVGSDKMAAFNAARTTALTEIAKVLNSTNASGVLSDSARHEVEQLIGPNATLKQIYAAANVLKQDMANRHESYQNQINDIQGRMKGKPKAQDANTPPPAAGGFDWNAHPVVK